MKKQLPNFRWGNSSKNPIKFFPQDERCFDRKQFQQVRKLNLSDRQNLSKCAIAL
jgi:hypothetical protein